MAAPDRLAVRMYENTIANEEKNALNALAHLKREINGIDPKRLAQGIANARNAAATLAELTAALAALKTAHDLRFLTEEA